MKYLIILFCLMMGTGLPCMAKAPYAAAQRNTKITHYLADYHDGTAPLVPVDLTAFFMAPKKRQSILFKLNERYDWRNVNVMEYVVYDYTGKKIQTGTAKIADGKAALELVLPQGYFEIKFTRYDETYGICSLPAYQGTRDPFFGMGTYLTFYVRDKFREGLVRNLSRCGIYSVRETCKWEDLNPARKKWRMEGLVDVGGQVVKRHEKLRLLLRKNNIKLLEMCGAAPEWMTVRDGSEYPEDLVVLSDEWLQWAKKWKRFWDCFQIWNEPNHDGHKGNVTEFAALVKAVAWAAGTLDINVTNGGFAFCDINYIKQCRMNGMMDAISYVSLHIYDNAASIPQILHKYHQEVPDKELWITETSKGFARKSLYSKRPDKSLSEELANCLDNAKNIIACKSGGVARYYPFSLISWPTDKIQLQRRNLYANGCLDYQYTPLRYMAVYAQAIRVLSGRSYIGEFPAGGSFGKLKVFADKLTAVIVISSATTEQQVSYQLDKSIDGIIVEGVDGRVLAANNNLIPVVDGQSYVTLPLNQFLQVYAKCLNTPVKQPQAVVKNKLSPVILQPFFSPADKFAVTKNYLKINKSIGQFDLKIKINNLSAQERSVMLKCQSSASFVVSAPEAAVKIPPHSTIVKTYQVKINTAVVCNVTGENQITVKGIDDNKLEVLPINFVVRICSDSISDYRQNSSEFIKMNLNNVRRWNISHIAKDGLMRVFISSGKNLCIQTKFKKYRNIRTWAAPTCEITEYRDKLHPDSVIIVRGKLKRSENNLQILLYEADGSRYETKLPINDKKNPDWQIMPVFFSDFQRSRGSWDENQNLDLNQVKSMAISIVCPHGGEMRDNIVTISDFVIIN